MEINKYYIEHFSLSHKISWKYEIWSSDHDDVKIKNLFRIFQYLDKFSQTQKPEFNLMIIQKYNNI